MAVTKGGPRTVAPELVFYGAFALVVTSSVGLVGVLLVFGFLVMPAVAAILIASLIMVFGMIPISAIISRNKHFGVLMLSILAVIATKLLVDGTGAHFSNGLLIFIIGILLLNDAAQGLVDRVARNRLAREAAEGEPHGEHS